MRVMRLETRKLPGLALILAIIKPGEMSVLGLVMCGHTSRKINERHRGECKF